MPSRYNMLYAEMAFTPNRDIHARRAFLPYAEATLAAYLQGQERAYAVRDVIRELESLFGAGALMPVQLLQTVLSLDDEERKAPLVTRALDFIARLSRRENCMQAW